LKFIFATSSKHKFAEAKTILSAYGIHPTMLSIKGNEVQKDDISEIAHLAVESVKPVRGGFIFLEDSGLYIDALKGFPGPYSSYTLRTIGLTGVLKLMSGEKSRTAHFDSAVGLRYPGGTRLFKARIGGTITDSPRGVYGFGFDPLFVPDGESKTLAEMDITKKCSVSHRGLAMRQMAEWLRAQGYV
jgi:XTP/dITP diphosphohydrolase